MISKEEITKELIKRIISEGYSRTKNILVEEYTKNTFGEYSTETIEIWPNSSIISKQNSISIGFKSVFKYDLEETKCKINYTENIPSKTNYFYISYKKIFEDGSYSRQVLEELNSSEMSLVLVLSEILNLWKLKIDKYTLSKIDWDRVYPKYPVETFRRYY